MTLRLAPSTEAFDSLAGILNMVGVALQDDRRFSAEAQTVNFAALALNRAGERQPLSIDAAEDAFLKAGAAVVDTILPRLDVAKLYLAERVAVAAVRQQRHQQGAQQ